MQDFSDFSDFKGNYRQMTMTRETIDRIKQSITPVQAIEYYTGQRGSRGKYLCPFHNDKHPSLSVKGDMWTCWACGEHGDIIDFVQKRSGVGFLDAVGKLATDFNVAVEVIPVSSAEDQARSMWDRIERECNRENRQQVCDLLDQKINKLNACYRVILPFASETVLRDYADKLDDLIAERSELGQVRPEDMMTPTEREISRELKQCENIVDYDLISLVCSDEAVKYLPDEYKGRG